MNAIQERYFLPPSVIEELQSRSPQFGYGLISEIAFYSRYSREKRNNADKVIGQESWADTVIRTVEGNMSIRLWWHKIMGLPFDETYWERVASDMARAMFNFHFLPGGRGLWASGTPVVYERGAGALYNCASVDINAHNFASAAEWVFTMLMYGVGVGFNVTDIGNVEVYAPNGGRNLYVVPDDKEGWATSLKLLIESYLKPQMRRVEFDYTHIRPMGAPIRTFGGTASGYKALETLHDRVRGYFESYFAAQQFDDLSYDETRLVVDVINAIGLCVVSGNVRRSAEIAVGRPNDWTFLNLKNYGKEVDGEWIPGPSADRASLGWMSNNSIALNSISDFKYIPEIAPLVRENGEPGLINFLNIQKYARYGHEKVDHATGSNPCSEIPLESYETCNLAEVFPTRCPTIADYNRALQLATIYASTVSLLPTHSEETNAVIARNRRIGISLSGIADWYDTIRMTDMITLMNRGYDVVEETNKKMALLSGVPQSVRLTTVKPSGTISQLAGVSSGMHYPVYRRFVRRIRMSDRAPINEYLMRAGVPWEVDVVSANTIIFELPMQPPLVKRAQRDVTLEQKAMLLTTLSRFWADNMVSNTLTFDPETEGDKVEDVIAMTIPFVKSMSLLPDKKDVYAQMPYESIGEEEYLQRKAAISPIDWSEFGGSDGQDSRFCNDEYCEI